MRLRTTTTVQAALPSRDEPELRHHNDAPAGGRGTSASLAPARLLPAEREPVTFVDPRLAAQLRGVLSALAEGQTVQRTPQRIVLTGVNTPADVPLLAATMAITCASSGYRVLLVDGNLHQPTLHETFGVPNDFGLVSLLVSSGSPHLLPQATMAPNLAVMTTGPCVSNAASLLTRERVFHRLEPLANVFDCIIVDCTSMPPALVSQISAGADHVVIAAKEHVSSMRDLANMVGVLRGDGFASPSVLMIQ